MNAATYLFLQDLLYAWMCGQRSARYVKKAMAGMGYTTDLRERSHRVDMHRLTDGQHYVIET